jgi:hypothetical protein
MTAAAVEQGVGPGGAHQLGDRLASERSQADPARRIEALGTAGARRHHDDHALSAAPGERQPRQHAGPADVQVFDHQDGRPAVPKTAQDADEGTEHPHAGRLGVGHHGGAGGRSGGGAE